MEGGGQERRRIYIFILGIKLKGLLFSGLLSQLLSLIDELVNIGQCVHECWQPSLGPSI